MKPRLRRIAIAAAIVAVAVTAPAATALASGPRFF